MNRTLRIVHVVGARPQFVKLGAVSREMIKRNDFSQRIIHTGQHYDTEMSDIFFDDLDIPKPDVNLGVGSDTQGRQTARMLQALEAELLKHKPDWVLVYGDTNSTLAAALAAVKLHLRVAHVEACLRSFNRFMPEEINRIVTDGISDLLFAPTRTAMNHARREGLLEHTVFSGDVMYDSISHYRRVLDRDPDDFFTPGLPSSYYLATVHRPANTDNPLRLSEIFAAFAALPHPVVLPLHPRTSRTVQEYGITPENVHLLSPAGYLSMLRLVLDSHCVLTDSGGLQKEAYFLGKRCVTLRDETEWIETVHDHWNTVTGADRNAIVRAALLPEPAAPQKDAFGCGNAAGVICDTLLSQS